MTSNYFRKLVNRVHPSGPNGWHTDFTALSKTNSTLGWAREVESSNAKTIDWSGVKPLTEEDYILRDDIDKHGQIDFPAQFLHQINDAQVIGPWGDIISSNGHLLTEFSPQNGVAETHSGLLRLRYPKCHNLKGRVFNLAQPGSVNYYHWLTQVLASLRLFNDGLDSINWFIVPELKSFHLTTLAVLCIPEDRIAV